jgi:hypothetical protein
MLDGTFTMKGQNQYWAADSLFLINHGNKTTAPIIYVVGSLFTSIDLGEISSLRE